MSTNRLQAIEDNLLTNLKSKVWKKFTFIFEPVFPYHNKEDISPTFQYYMGKIKFNFSSHLNLDFVQDKLLAEQILR